MSLLICGNPRFDLSLSTAPMPTEGNRQRVRVPDDLRDFLIHVRDAIRNGDDEATEPSDDLLQSDNAYGGLDRNRTTFSFVYFPGPDRRERWEFTLTPGEIEEFGPDGGDGLAVRRFQAG
jgi:hypothetical protein